jgi:alkyl sulfatase BDS1-like metallo-beta-lactamase superfamily hydrolase
MISDQDLEQAQAALRDMAKMLFDHLTRLVNQGFTRQEALPLTIAMQHSLLRPSDPK